MEPLFTIPFKAHALLEMGMGHQEMPQGITWAPNMLPSAPVTLKLYLLGLMKVSDSCQHGDTFMLLIFCQKESRMAGQQQLLHV